VIASREEIERAIDTVFAGARRRHTNGPINGEATNGAAAAAGLGVRAPLRIGEVLVAHGAVSQERVNAGLEQQRKSGGRLGDILLHNTWIDEATLVNVLAQQQELPVVDLRDLTPDPGALARLPEPVMRELRCIPIAVDEETLYLAVDEAPGPEELARLRQYSQLTIRPFLATRSSIDDLLQRLFRTAYIDTATYDMVRRFPDDSANRVITAAQRAALAAALLVVVVAIVLFPIPALIALLGIASVFYAAVSAYKIFLTYEALGHEYELDITTEEVEALDEHGLPPYTILVPLYKEAEVIPQLAAGIDELDYPKHLLDVRLLCEEDDLETIETINELHLPPHFKLVIVPESQPRTKPKACNYGLLHAEGKYCVIYDAEDQPDPDQLKRVVLAFEKADSSVTCVQAKLNYFNRDQNLLTKWFSTEYSMWFDLILPGLDAQNVPIPLGGTSNHFVTARLVELGAWDPYNVTEDADLGIRLHKAGYQTAIIDSTTLEEANSEVKNWIRQRSRWIKGYIQTWLVHMRHPVRLLRDVGLKSFISFNLIVGGTFIFLLNPIFWLLTTLFAITQSGLIRSLFPGIVFYASSILLFIGNFAFVYLNVAGAVQRRHFSLAKTALLSPLYWGLMSFAAWKGFIQLFTNPFYWEKTQHGLSESFDVAPEPAPVRAEG
jgi:cellulose synthase/poly-beta-1,6-N-acetylglucosamine synthase-like glycosyltransferase